MHLSLFKALKTLKLSDERATEVVEAVEEHIALKINEATAELRAQLKAQTWVIASVGFLIAIIGLAPHFIKLFN